MGKLDYLYAAFAIIMYRAGAETCPYGVDLNFIVGEGFCALPLFLSYKLYIIILNPIINLHDVGEHLWAAH